VQSIEPERAARCVGTVVLLARSVGAELRAGAVVEAFTLRSALLRLTALALTGRVTSLLAIAGLAVLARRAALTAAAIGGRTA
jgi:hypothetical protein